MQEEAAELMKRHATELRVLAVADGKDDLTVLFTHAHGATLAAVGRVDVEGMACKRVNLGSEAKNLGVHA